MCKDFIKVLITIIMIFSTCFSFTISSFAEYSITQLGDDGWNPQINKSQVMFWNEGLGYWGEIFFMTALP